MASLVQSVVRALFPATHPPCLADQIADLDRKLDSLSWETGYKDWRIPSAQLERTDETDEALLRRLHGIRARLVRFEPVRLYKPLIFDNYGTARGAITGLGEAAKDLAQKSPQRKLQVKITKQTINIALTEVFYQLSAVYNGGPWLQFLRSANVYQIEAGKLTPIRIEDDAASDELSSLRDQMAPSIKLLQDAEDNLLAWEFSVDTELREARSLEGQWEKRYPRLANFLDSEGRVVNFLAEKWSAFHAHDAKYIAAQQERGQRKALYEIYVDFESGTYTILSFGFLKEQR